MLDKASELPYLSLEGDPIPGPGRQAESEWQPTHFQMF